MPSTGAATTTPSCSPMSGGAAALSGGSAVPVSAMTFSAPSSLIRHAVPRIRWNVTASAMSAAAASPLGTRDPVSAPASSTAPESAVIALHATSAPSPATSPLPSSKAKRNLPGNDASSGVAHSFRSSSATSGLMSVRPPDKPDSGEPRMLRTRSWLGFGSKPAPDSAATSFPSSRTARSWRFALDVRWIAPSPRVSAHSATAIACAPVSAPPGNRTRASSPSFAGCVAKTPGHASARTRSGTGGDPGTPPL